MNVSLQYAETHLADLISAADGGEQVEILRPGKRTLKLVVSNTTAPVTHEGKRILGAGVGEMRSISFEEWQAMDDNLADQPLVSSGEA